MPDNPSVTVVGGESATTKAQRLNPRQMAEPEEMAQVLTNKLDLKRQDCQDSLKTACIERKFDPLCLLTSRVTVACVVQRLKRLHV